MKEKREHGGGISPFSRGEDQTPGSVFESEKHGIVTGLCTTVCDVCTTNNVCTQTVSGYLYPRVEIFVV